ncbi:sigma-54 dependent transcriptional regulator [Brucella gallinifaecis]|uniref:sigma-54-dependent transcriptional regulator n=1 Tax=Brucella gallinifaecis TaxID=215590 RepID=UPI00235F54D6|nr:sigma-54 dependent transcriptional regulator [Brucella gallinifaecis]
MKNIPVILVDDDNALRRATRQTLELAGYEVQDFGGAVEALAVISSAFEGVVVTDVRMPNIDGLELFSRIQSIDTDLPVILITGHGDIPMAVQAIQNGAYDFIAKPFAAERLIHSILRAAEHRKLVLENRRLRELAVDAQNDMPLIGQTAAIENLRRTIRDIADTDVDVLIAGETGSGKEVVAQLLHDWGSRCKGNFVALNCGALPETVIESELFGHEAGAFTGAQKKRIGRIEHASGGTLFLDEIESMPAATQVKLLRVLEMREITPLGTNEVRPVDLRVVAAAKIDLGDPKQRGDFREDLYYRLNVVTLTIPPLRERRDDIPLLFSYFLERAARRFNRDIPIMDSATHRYLMEHNWPGNVRELVHFAERYALGVKPVSQQQVSLQEEQETLPKRLERFEADLIRKTLAANNGNVQDTLEALGIPRKTFYDKMQRHGINRADYKTGN